MHREDTYLFRKIKSASAVMLALAILQIILGSPLGYYWNALQAELSGAAIDVSGEVSGFGLAMGIAIYVIFFGAISALGFSTAPHRTGFVPRLLLLVPMLICIASVLLDFDNITPVAEKFANMYTTLEYAIYIPYAVIGIFLAVYIALVTICPALRLTQVFAWLTSIVAILFYVAAAIYMIYGHTMAILSGAFSKTDFFIYLITFATDVVSYFFMLSVLMTYCTIKREERQDALELETEIENARAEEEAVYAEAFAPETFPPRTFPPETFPPGTFPPKQRR